jgi:hypothetical protein
VLFLSEIDCQRGRDLPEEGDEIDQNPPICLIPLAICPRAVVIADPLHAFMQFAFREEQHLLFAELGKHIQNHLQTRLDNLSFGFAGHPEGEHSHPVPLRAEFPKDFHPLLFQVVVMAEVLLGIQVDVEQHGEGFELENAFYDLVHEELGECRTGFRKLVL